VEQLRIQRPVSEHVQAARRTGWRVRNHLHYQRIGRPDQLELQPARCHPRQRYREQGHGLELTINKGEKYTHVSETGSESEFDRYQNPDRADRIVDGYFKHKFYDNYNYGRKTKDVSDYYYAYG
jgi:hypothetical protein